MSMYPISSINANSGTITSFDFTSIPSNFNHLQLRCFIRASLSQSSPYDLVITVNGANPTTFAYSALRGDGFSASATSAISDNVFRITTAVPTGSHIANMFGLVIIDILDYANTNKNKTVKALFGWDNGGGSSPSAGWTGLAHSTWFDTSVINRLNVGTFGNFAQFSRVDLYGISTSGMTGT